LSTDSAPPHRRRRGLQPRALRTPGEHRQRRERTPRRLLVGCPEESRRASL